MARPRPRPPTGGDRLRLRPARRGGACGQRHRSRGQQPLMGTAACSTVLAKGGQLQGARKGLPPAVSPIASRGSDASRRGGRPLEGRLSAGKGNRRLRRGSGGGGGTEGARGWERGGDSGTHDVVAKDHTAW
ncbi:hypothetical protein BHE74_00051541 [Ensete ventricosum]|nr:hypothetical protein BHE74_00051541 [Ensete ventricosum]